MKRICTYCAITVLALLSATYVCGEDLVARGMTESVSDSTLGAAVNGTVAKIHRREGDSVKKDDIIVELENSVETLEVERRKLVADNTAKLEAAESRAETFRIDLEATRKLFDTTKSVSKDDMQKKELEYDLAIAELEGLRMEEAREAIEYKMAMAQLDRKRVRAPFDGTVVKVFLEVGENCNSQQPLARVVDTTKCQFTTHVDSNQPWDLKAGKKVELLLQDEDGEIAKTGEVEFVSPVVDPSSGLQEVRVLFDNVSGEVTPGVSGSMAVKAR